MKARNQLIFSVLSSTAIAVVIPLCILLSDRKKDSDDYIIASILALVGGYVSFRRFRALKHVSKDAVVSYGPPANTPPFERIRYLKRLLVILLISFGGLSIFVVSDLNALESGQATSVYTWWPIALLYDFFGYWGAVLFLPALYILLCFLGFRKIASLKREMQEGEVL